MNQNWRRERILLSLIFAAVMPLRADQWTQPPASRTAIAIDGSARVVESSVGEVVRRVIKVYTRSEGGGEVLSWQANLLNCPVQIFVAPAGKTLVTLDRWGSIGSDAVVFYGAGGTLLKRYDTPQDGLISDAEALKVTRSVSSFHWDQEAHAGFMAGGDFFWIWLAWGRVLIFDAHSGNTVNAENLRLDFTQGRPMVLKTAETMAESGTPSQRIAAARLAGWLNGQAVLPLLQKLARDPYHEDTGQQTHADDPWGRFAASSPLLLLRRVYPVRRAAAEEIHIKFGHAYSDGVEELVPL